jgi:hypothetical protein
MGDVKLTPYVGFGAFFVVAKISTPNHTETDLGKSPLVMPGVSLRYDVPSTPLSFGIDARAHYITDVDHTTLGFYATAGARF